MIEPCNYIKCIVASKIIVFKPIDNIGGGNCLFHALYSSMLFPVSDHIQLRQSCYSIVNTHREVAERIFYYTKPSIGMIMSLDEYVNRQRRVNEWALIPNIID